MRNHINRVQTHSNRSAISLDEKLNILEELAGLLAASDSLEGVMGKIVTAAARVTETDEGCLFLLDFVNDQLTLSSQTGVYKRPDSTVRLSEKTNALVSVLNSGLPEYIHTEELIYAPGKSANSLLVVPLVAQKKKWGVLCTSHLKQDKVFSEEDRSFLVTLANVGALIIASRFDRAQAVSQSDDFSNLRSASQSLTVPQREELLQKIADKALRVSKADAVVFYELNDRDRTNSTSGVADVIVPPIVAGILKYPEVLCKKGVKIPHNESIVFDVISSGKPYYADNAASDWTNAGFRFHRNRANFISREEIVSSAGIPAMIGDDPVGVFFVNYRTPHKFTQQLRDQLEIFAGSAALAVENASLAKMLERQLKNTEALYNISKDISTKNVGLSRIMRSILKSIREIIGGGAGICFLADDLTNELEIVATYKIQPKDTGSRLVIGNGVAGSIAKKRERLIVNDYQRWDDRNTKCLFEGPPIQRIAGVPILWKGELLGVIEFVSRDLEILYTERHIEVLNSFAAPAAIAINNARLYSFRNALVASNPNAIIAVNNQGHVTEFNEAAERIMGYSKEEVIRRPVESLYWDGREEAVRIRSLLRQHRQRLSEETFVQSKEGKKIPIHLSASLLEDLDGQELGSVGLMEDLRIAALRGRTKRLIDAFSDFDRSEDLDHALETITIESVLLLDAEAGMVFLAERGGVTSRSQFGLDGLELTELESACAILEAQAFNEAIFRGKDFPFELQLLKQGKSSVLLPIQIDDRILGYLLFESHKEDQFLPGSDLFDILSRQAGIVINRLQLLEYREQSRQRLLNSANAIAAGQLATGLIHEIRNVLNSISLTISNVVDEVDSLDKINPKKRKSISSRLESVEDEINKMERIAKPMQRFALVQMKPEKSFIYINEIINNAYDLLKNRLKDMKIKLNRKLAGSLDRPTNSSKGNPVWADGKQLRQVLINLVLNAVAVSPRRGAIAVESRLHSDKVEVKVIDYGPGIPSDIKKRMFEPFFTTKESGTGLGLYICKMIIQENHLGRVEVHSKEGKGSSISFYIPRTEK